MMSGWEWFDYLAVGVLAHAVIMHLNLNIRTLCFIYIFGITLAPFLTDPQILYAIRLSFTQIGPSRTFQARSLYSCACYRWRKGG